jgi:SAM-dependent methyltransferase
MPTPSPEQVIDSQRQDWNRVAGGWEKWDRFFDEQMAFLNHRLVADARLRSGLRVLDLGSGTGYPALLAAQTVGASGSVMGIDLAEQMLEAARRKAASLKLSNITFGTGDVTTLPFEAASLDAVTTRFCLMFLPEISKAASGMGGSSRLVRAGEESLSQNSHGHHQTIYRSSTARSGCSGNFPSRKARRARHHAATNRVDRYF